MKLPIQNNINLKPYNTMALSATAKHFLELNSEGFIPELCQHNLLGTSCLILGGGSNVLFTKDYSGLVIRNQLKGIDILYEDDLSITLKVAAGENWHDFVLYCVSKGYGGLENLSLIPGTVGAAPIQNIGAYDVEVKNSLISLEAYSLQTGVKQIFTNSDCRFAYRNSIFKHELKQQFLITSVNFKLHKYPKLNFSYAALTKHLKAMSFDKLSIQVISDAVIHIRQSKLPDPRILPNTGSFFKNPIISDRLYENLLQQFPDLPHYPTSNSKEVKIPAAWLIEQCGLKGKDFGKVSVYEKQALVLVNHNNGHAHDLMAAVDIIQTAVHRKFQIQLEPEVQLV